MKAQVIMNLPLLRYTPHSSNFPAPADYETRVSRAEFMPITIDQPIKLTHTDPIPTPAISALSLRCPKKERFTRSTVLCTKPVRIFGIAMFIIIMVRSHKLSGQIVLFINLVPPSN